jgi:pimeloyl-ACP methyl ester carboxylesterase
MSRRTLTGLLAAPLLIAGLTAAPVTAAPVSAAAAPAAPAFGPCPNSPGFSCATVAVPLDRSGRVPGAIALSVERKSAGANASQDAVLAVAGGPGQAALPLDEFISKALGPALGARDLLLFDQRGTGASGPLSCTALSSVATGTVGQLLERCALQIGPARGAYTTAESVEDIEAIRHAAGYRKLVLYGTSYGTKVALEYAERYPSHVEALLLDSVVPADGPEPFAIPTFRAIGSVLGELCANRACAGITANPLADVASLAARLRKHPLRGAAFDGSGRRSPATLSETGLLEILQAGDLNPTLRALLPAAVRSALRADPDPLLRLHLLSQGLIPSVPKQPPESSPSIDEALFVTTSCEETPFPWQRGASSSSRLSEALAALSAVPGADFYPFDASTALQSGLITDCASWPDASAPPPPSLPLPNVPTLILSGAQDLRTPTSVAGSVAALIPDAQLLVVPYTGHSVLGSDFSGCAAAAVTAFFAGSSVAPCTSTRDIFAPTPITPTKLAYLRSPRGLTGKPGRTLTAVLDAIVDLDRQVVAATLQANQELPSGSSFGGLRGGYARLTSSAAILRGFSFVAGVKLTGAFPLKNGELQPATIRIYGSQASPGTVSFGSGKQITGRLGGRHFDVSLAKIKLSRVSRAGEWPSHPIAFPLAGLIEGRPARRH